jgi:hypothetical protein
VTRNKLGRTPSIVIYSLLIAVFVVAPITSSAATKTKTDYIPYVASVQRE